MAMGEVDVTWGNCLGCTGCPGGVVARGKWVVGVVARGKWVVGVVGTG